MYVLTKNYSVPYETSGTTVMAISSSFNTLKKKASEDSQIYDQQWKYVVYNDKDVCTLDYSDPMSEAEE